MSVNPYTLSFGKEPTKVLPRFSQMQEVLDNFEAEPPSQQVYMITGMRGSGKTVLMTEIVHHIRKNEQWVTVELNPARDLLTGLAAKLYNHSSIKRLFSDAKIDLSFFGIGLEIKKAEPVTDIEVAISRMLEILKKKGKKVLISIDEATNTDEMKVFASSFQIFLREDYPIYLLMTGLYENIDALQNNKILTFLHRAPKLSLAPLDIASVAIHYEEAFSLDMESAKEMAVLTKGYPFAFQVLGYYTFQKNGDYNGVIPEYRQYLFDNVYNKIWSELSPKEKKILYAIASSSEGKTGEVLEIAKMKKNELSPYRDKLIKKGYINGDDRGYLCFSIPLFDSYVKYSYIE